LTFTATIIAASFGSIILNWTVPGEASTGEPMFVVTGTWQPSNEDNNTETRSTLKAYIFINTPRRILSRTVLLEMP
jgi:hypothetical protein